MVYNAGTPLESVFHYLSILERKRLVFKIIVNEKVDFKIKTEVEFAFYFLP